MSKNNKEYKENMKNKMIEVQSKLCDYIENNQKDKNLHMIKSL